tara:strand:+ start:106 stop:420 length:315 start_codon:yes stop_codon:yes gene_type:complete
MEVPMNDSITIPRESLETFLSIANRILDRTSGAAPEAIERAEVTLQSNNRKHLAEAVYQAEKAIFDNDVGSLTAEQMSDNANKRRACEDSFSRDKTDFIEGRRR